MNTATMIVGKVDDQGDRILLYPKGFQTDRIGCHVIAKTSDIVKVGDKIEYEPFGINFGWFIRVIK